MKNNNIPLAIILKRTQNGYAFDSLQQLLPNQDKNKKPKPGRKPIQKGAPNRLIKQIGLSNDHFIPQITPLPEPQPINHLDEEQPQNIPIFTQAPEDEDISCQIDRETDLPKTPAIWFDKLSIHQIEKKELKEFFEGSDSKNPDLYLKYRNFIVDSYLKNPRRFLTKISCRRILRGDVNAIMRIHEFLEKHGIINFSLNYDGNYSFKTNTFSKHHDQRIKPQTYLKSPPEQDEETAEKQIDTNNMTITVINKNFSRSYRPCCFECRLICGIVWFAKVSDEESANPKNLCFECWSKKQDNEKSEYIKVDIVKKMEAHSKEGKNLTKTAWSIEQNVKLLDFMSNGQKSWKKLLDQLGGKRNIEDVILQFLQFPISNVEIKEAKKQFSNESKSQQKIVESIGFDPSDYKKLLKQFYPYPQKSKMEKISQNGKVAMKETEAKVEASLQTNESEHPEEIKQILALTIQQIKAKVEGLREREEFITEQNNYFESLNSFKNNKAKGNEEEQGLQNSSEELQNKSKPGKLSQERKNENLQSLDDQNASN